MVEKCNNKVCNIHAERIVPQYNVEHNKLFLMEEHEGC